MAYCYSQLTLHVFPLQVFASETTHTTALHSSSLVSYITQLQLCMSSFLQQLILWLYIHLHQCQISCNYSSTCLHFWNKSYYVFTTVINHHNVTVQEFNTNLVVLKQIHTLSLFNTTLLFLIIMSFNSLENTERKETYK